MIADLREEIKEKNGRLEAANYKIGEMQSEINNRIPLLEYRAKDDELVKLKINHTQEQNKLKESIHDLSINIQEEKINKYIYAGLVFFLGILGAIMFFLTL
ncbi:MAG: hypothetical protein U9Q15_02730 [Patescibacteria group bacterium]|nr:hypothetical protein [Patescibacteria group bacterium]